MRTAVAMTRAALTFRVYNKPGSGDHITQVLLVTRTGLAGFIQSFITLSFLAFGIMTASSTPDQRDVQRVPLHVRGSPPGSRVRACIIG